MAERPQPPNDAPALDETVVPARADGHLLEFLICPVTRTPLRYDANRQELISKAARLVFPIRDGIAILVEDEARSLGD